MTKRQSGTRNGKRHTGLLLGLALLMPGGVLAENLSRQVHVDATVSPSSTASAEFLTSVPSAQETTRNALSLSSINPSAGGTAGEGRVVLRLTCTVGGSVTLEAAGQVASQPCTGRLMRLQIPVQTPAPSRNADPLPIILTLSF